MALRTKKGSLDDLSKKLDVTSAIDPGDVSFDTLGSAGDPNERPVSREAELRMAKARGPENVLNDGDR